MSVELVGWTGRTGGHGSLSYVFLIAYFIKSYVIVEMGAEAFLTDQPATIEPDS